MHHHPSSLSCRFWEPLPLPLELVREKHTQEENKTLCIYIFLVLFFFHECHAVFIKYFVFLHVYTLPLQRCEPRLLSLLRHSVLNKVSLNLGDMKIMVLRNKLEDFSGLTDLVSLSEVCSSTPLLLNINSLYVSLFVWLSRPTTLSDPNRKRSSQRSHRWVKNNTIFFCLFLKSELIKCYLDIKKYWDLFCSCATLYGQRSKKLLCFEAC